MNAANKRLQREALVLRVLWMLVFFLVWQVATPLLLVLVIGQAGYRFWVGEPHAMLMRFGGGVSQYLAQIGRFAVFQTEQKPWPLADWPAVESTEQTAAEQDKEHA